MAETDTVPLEVLPRDIAAWREGNTGIPYVHRFDSGRPGPHVVVNALTHGNEICGVAAVARLLEGGVRPLAGVLTVSLSNVEAYESFDAARPFDSRQLVHNMNRIWSGDWLDGSEDSPELRRARALRPVMAAADHILDLHSTSQDVEPFWVYPAFARNAEVALAIGRPAVHLVMPDGLGSGVPLIQHGAHGRPDGKGVALVAECGQHFRQATSDLAVEVTLDFLAHFGLIAPRRPAAQPQRRYELLQTYVVRTADFRFARPLVGFETFAAGERVATDGGEALHAPEDCTVLMPARVPVPGREGFYLARRL